MNNKQTQGIIDSIKNLIAKEEAHNAELNTMLNAKWIFNSKTTVKKFIKNSDTALKHYNTTLKQYEKYLKENG